MARPIGIDLFSGVGGLSLGFEQAGFDVVAAVEYDSVHAAAHAFNFPRCAVLPRSVVGLSGAEIRDCAGIGGRRVDVVFGGAPCQGFSMIGQRMLDDPRNALVKEFVRIVRELDASYFVFENVKGLTVGDHKRILDEIIAAFREIGYNIRLPWRVLNSAWYGVPQNRERLILIGARRGMPLPSYPRQATVPAIEENALPGFPVGPTCKDALGDIPDAESFETLCHRDWVRTERWGTPSAYATEMRCLFPESWHSGYVRRWDSMALTSSARSEHTEISRRRFAETKAGSVEPISRLYRLCADGIANTLRAGSDSQRGAFTSPRPIHYLYHRCITVREMARLHGFPDWFRFHVSKWNGARQVGNAVPPPLARAVANAIIDALGVSSSRPADTIELGDPALLEMDMSQASAYWNIPIPIGKRDKKSGMRKRSQSETEAALQKKRLYA